MKNTSHESNKEYLDELVNFFGLTAGYTKNDITVAWNRKLLEAGKDQDLRREINQKATELKDAFDLNGPHIPLDPTTFIDEVNSTIGDEIRADSAGVSRIVGENKPREELKGNVAGINFTIMEEAGIAHLAKVPFIDHRDTNIEDINNLILNNTATESLEEYEQKMREAKTESNATAAPEILDTPTSDNTSIKSVHKASVELDSDKPYDDFAGEELDNPPLDEGDKPKGFVKKMKSWFKIKPKKDDSIIPSEVTAEAPLIRDEANKEAASTENKSTELEKLEETETKVASEDNTISQTPVELDYSVFEKAGISQWVKGSNSNYSIQENLINNNPFSAATTSEESTEVEPDLDSEIGDLNIEDNSILENPEYTDVGFREYSDSIFNFVNNNLDKGIDLLGTVEESFALNTGESKFSEENVSHLRGKVRDYTFVEVEIFESLNRLKKRIFEVKFTDLSDATTDLLDENIETNKNVLDYEIFILAPHGSRGVKLLSELNNLQKNIIKIRLKRSSTLKRMDASNIQSVLNKPKINKPELSENTGILNRFLFELSEARKPLDDYLKRTNPEEEGALEIIYKIGDEITSLESYVDAEGELRGKLEAVFYEYIDNLMEDYLKVRKEKLRDDTPELSDERLISIQALSEIENTTDKARRGGLPLNLSDFTYIFGVLGDLLNKINEPDIKDKGIGTIHALVNDIKKSEDIELDKENISELTIEIKKVEENNIDDSEDDFNNALSTAIGDRLDNFKTDDYKNKAESLIEALKERYEFSRTSFYVPGPSDDELKALDEANFKNLQDTLDSGDEALISVALGNHSDDMYKTPEYRAKFKEVLNSHDEDGGDDYEIVAGLSLQINSPSEAIGAIEEGDITGVHALVSMADVIQKQVYNGIESVIAHMEGSDLDNALDVLIPKLTRMEYKSLVFIQTIELLNDEGLLKERGGKLIDMVYTFGNEDDKEDLELILK